MRVPSAWIEHALDAPVYPRKAPRQISRRQARPVSASTLTVKTSLAPVADELVRVQHAGVAFRLPSEYLMEVAMILVQRSVSVAPGMLSAAMAFANEIATQVKATTGVDVKIAVPVGGNAAQWPGFPTMRT
jgi:hypothetical protein